jgi:predicted flap endonuclease-1-like 5' DNA nuclease
MNIEDIEGVGPVNAGKLQAAGVRTTDDLLQRAGSRSGRDELEAATGISHSQILEWTNHADLYRISGVGSEYADLLEAAGVDSVAELAQRNAKNLAETFGELDAARNTVRNIPTEAVISGWIEEARTLPRMVEY